MNPNKNQRHWRKKTRTKNTQGYYMTSRKQTLSLFGFLLRSMLILRSAYPPSYLLPHISEKYEISNTNMKFFSNSGQFSRLHPASHRPLCSVFHQMRQQLPQIRCFTKSTAWFSSRFFPKNRKTTAEQIKWWIRDHKCWRVIPTLDSGNGFLPKDGISTPDSGSLTQRSRHWTEPWL